MQAKRTFDPNAMARRILELRAVHRQSRPDFAKHLQMPMSTLKNYEMNYRRPHVEFLETIGHTFGNDWVLYILDLRTGRPSPMHSMMGTHDVVGVSL